MSDTVIEVRRQREQLMGDTEVKVRFAIGSAAAAAAIFAPLAYKWKGVLTAVAADCILTGIFGNSPLRRMIGGSA